MAKPDEQPRYTISLAAEFVGMHPQTLRIYESRGLLLPNRTLGGTRRYSDADLARVRRIQELTTIGLNLAGVQMVLELDEQLERLYRRLERLTA